MEYRTLEINVMSAKDLNKVNLISKMDVYVVVSITGGGDKAKQKQKTTVDNNGNTSPSWNFPMKFTVEEAAARQTLVFKLRSARALGDKDIGEVHVPIKELVDSKAVGSDGKQQFVSYQVRKPNGQPKGQLTFSYKFGEKIAAPAKGKADHPMTAYPAAAAATTYPTVAGTSTVYPPPAAGYPVASGSGAYPPPKDGVPPPPAGYPQGGPPSGEYPPPPQGGYGYAYAAPPPYGGYPPGPPRPGYGYPPPPPPGYGGYVQQPAKPPKKNNFGLGLGAGLLGGALGGLLIGDMVSDAAFDGFDGGFDGGFDC